MKIGDLLIDPLSVAVIIATAHAKVPPPLRWACRLVYCFGKTDKDDSCEIVVSSVPVLSAGQRSSAVVPLGSGAEIAGEFRDSFEF